MELMTNPIKTYSSEEMVKLNTTIPVPYDQDLDKAMEVIIEAVNTVSIVRQKTSTKAFVV
jgi:small-conductance mechanosensitive channel